MKVILQIRVETKMLTEQDFNSFNEMSKWVGGNIDYIQASGGNTSIKDTHTLRVKASGMQLKDAMLKDIFVDVDLDKLVKNNYQYTEDMLINGKDKRPSIETNLHAIIPNRFVFHTHSINTIAHTVENNAYEYFKSKLSGFKWCLIDYARPGKELFEKISDELEKKELEIIILKNHGVVFATDDIDDMKRLIQKYEGIIDEPMRKNETSAVIKLNFDEYSNSNIDELNVLAFDNASLRILSDGILYPDHIVFLGKDIFVVHDLSSVDAFVAEYFDDNGCKPSYLIVKDHGVLLYSNITDAELDMLQCLARVVLKIKLFDNISYIYNSEVLALLDWEAEKYRKKLIKKQS